MGGKDEQEDLDTLILGLKMYDVTGVFTRFLVALVDNGCPVEAIAKAIKEADIKGASI